MDFWSTANPSGSGEKVTEAMEKKKTKNATHQYISSGSFNSHRTTSGDPSLPRQSLPPTHPSVRNRINVCPSPTFPVAKRQISRVCEMVAQLKWVLHIVQFSTSSIYHIPKQPRPEERQWQRQRRRQQQQLYDNKKNKKKWMRRGRREREMEGGEEEKRRRK